MKPSNIKKYLIILDMKKKMKEYLKILEMSMIVFVLFHFAFNKRISL